jgi:hypothetical protein
MEEVRDWYRSFRGKKSAKRPQLIDDTSVVQGG